MDRLTSPSAVRRVLLPLLCLPLLGAVGCHLLARSPRERAFLGLVATLLPFLHTLLLLTQWEPTSGELQFTSTPLLGADGLALTLCALTTLLAPPILLSTWKAVRVDQATLIPLLLGTEAVLLLTFLATDFLLFYVAFEASLLPLLLLVARFGGRGRRVQAAQSLFLYTLGGSLLLLLALLLLLSEGGGLGWTHLLALPVSPERQQLLFLLLFAGMAVKVPMVPVHLWLPEAHVEAPTAGSVLLAGVILKLGGYGLLRWVWPLLPEAVATLRPLLLTVAVVGVLYGSLACLAQTDLKKIIAYSSIAHMNGGLLGLLSGTLPGLMGGMLLMVSHGLVSSALFLLVGVLYDRYHTRTWAYYRGLAPVMPLFTLALLFFTLANVAFPGTASFPAELLTFLGGGLVNPGATALATLLIVLGPCYALLLHHRLTHGALSAHLPHLFQDLTLKEAHLLLPLAGLTLVLGLHPAPLFHWMTLPALHLLTPLLFRGATPWQGGQDPPVPAPGCSSVIRITWWTPAPGRSSWGSLLSSSPWASFSSWAAMAARP